MIRSVPVNAPIFRIAGLSVLLLTAFSVSAKAQYTTESDGNGGLIITGYSGGGGAIVIPSSIGNLPVTSIGENAFQDNASLTSVTIPGGVTSIGLDAFEGCSNLASVTIPNGVTFLGTAAFQDTALTSVVIPATVTTIGDGEFFFCTQLSSLTFLGNAPTLGSSDFYNVAGDFTVYYYNDAIGFTSPTWDGVAAVGNGNNPIDAFSGTATGTTNLKYSAWYGYYLSGSYPLGYQYVYRAAAGVYLYDYTSGHFWYAQAGSFPIVYDFTLGAYLYYYNASTPHRHFYDFATHAVITE